MKRLNSIFQKVMVCMFMTIAVNTPLFAQDLEEEEPIKDPRSEQTFRLIYIAQGDEEEMPTETLVTRLKDTYGRGIGSGPMIFYLAGGQEDGPIIVKIGCEKDIDYDKEGMVFEKNVLENIRNPKRYPTQDDKKRLLQLLYNTDEKEDGVSIFDDARQPLYKETRFEFHVGQNFWDTRKNETIIASLYFELNMKHHIDVTKKIDINVFCPRKMNYDVEKPYGLLNIDDCNKNLRPITYY